MYNLYSIIYRSYSLVKAFAVRAQRAKNVTNRWATQISAVPHKHPRIVASVFSVSLHVLFVLFLLIQPEPTLSGGGYDGQGTAPGNGMAVTLVEGAELSQMLLTVKPPSEEKPEDKTVPLEIMPSDAPLELTDTATAPQLLSDLSSDDMPDQPQEAGRSGSQGDGGEGTDGNDLWGAIAPCWNRLADDKTLPVTLNVSFDADGNIASPPRIEADAGSQSDAQVQRSETIAMQALAACGAYTMAENRAGVKVRFPRPVS